MHCLFEEEKIIAIYAKIIDNLAAIYKKSQGNPQKAVFEARKLFSKYRLC